eukprot:gene13141-9409_t
MSKFLVMIYTLLAEVVPTAKLLLHVEKIAENASNRTIDGLKVQPSRKEIALMMLHTARLDKPAIKAAELLAFSPSYRELIDQITTTGQFSKSISLKKVIQSLDEYANKAISALIDAMKDDVRSGIALEHFFDLHVIPDDNQRNAFHYLCMARSTVILESLLNAYKSNWEGDDANIRNVLAERIISSFEFADRRGHTPLSYCALRYGRRQHDDVGSKMIEFLDTLKTDLTNPAFVDHVEELKETLFEDPNDTLAVPLVTGEESEEVEGLQTSETHVDGSVELLQSPKLVNTDDGGWNPKRLHVDKEQYPYFADENHCDIKQVYLDDVPMPDQEEFFMEYLNSATPVIFRGAALNASTSRMFALRNVFRKDHFVKVYGGKKVTASTLPYGESFGVKSAGKTLRQVANADKVVAVGSTKDSDGTEEKGCVYELTVTTERDINRQIVKSDSASIYIRELDFEIPAGTQKGSINTLEGVFKRAIDDLSALQPLRMIQTPEVGAKVAEIIDSLQEIASGNRLPFHIRLDDPAGNSFIENPVAPALDPMLTVHYYQRSADQDRSLGLDPDQENFKKAQIDHSDEIMEGRKVFGGEVGQTAPTATSSEQDGETVEALGKTEVISIPSICPSCHKEGESLTALTNIPHFKEVIIMSFTCKFCGQRTSDVKAGGAVPTYGTEVRLLLTSEEDMKRDVLKSDTAMIHIPELDLELQHGTLGGVFSTLEGLMQKIYKNLAEDNPFVGDSTYLHHSEDPEIRERGRRMDDFIEKLKACVDGKMFPFTMIIRDPLGNSFISSPLGTFLPPELDKNLTLTDFERSWEENEEFGLNDLNTKDFETGYEHDDHIGPVLPDRLTNIHPKGSDHPTPFAKGTYEQDNTQGAISADKLHLPEFNPELHHKQLQPKVVEEVEEKADAVDSVPVEISPEVILQAIKRDFGDDSDLQYIPREEFAGRREGFVFRLGSKGIGYYTDRYYKPKVEEPSVATSEETH